MSQPIADVELPALDGRSSLGFLAALGLLNVLSWLEQYPVRLSFSDEHGTAVIHSTLQSLDEIVAKLEAFVETSAKDSALVGLDPRFPPHPGTGADPLRRPRDEYRQLVAQISKIDSVAGSMWLPHLVTDMAVDEKGRADNTPFAAPSGKQSWRSFFSNPLSAVRNNPAYICEALSGWRRVKGVTGEYLDHHVINSSADDPEGKSAERGVPGATWLATMALPLLRLTGDGSNASATLWHQFGRRSFITWPLWRQPLGVRAVQALIEHPSLSPWPADGELAVSSAAFGPLGVFAVYGAERQRISGRNFAGVLAPVSMRVERRRRDARSARGGSTARAEVLAG